MFGLAELKSSTIFLKKLPSGPVKAFHTVSSALPDGGWNAPVPPLPLGSALPPVPLLSAGLAAPDDSAGLAAPDDSAGLAAPPDDDPPGDEPAPLLPLQAATTITAVAPTASSRRDQGAWDIARSPRSHPIAGPLPEQTGRCPDGLGSRCA